MFLKRQILVLELDVEAANSTGESFVINPRCAGYVDTTRSAQTNVPGSQNCAYVGLTIIDFGVDTVSKVGSQERISGRSTDGGATRSMKRKILSGIGHRRSIRDSV